MQFGEKLRIIRQERRLNQPEFAKLLGTNKQSINRYEKGVITPRLRTVEQFALQLGVSVESLVDDHVAFLSSPSPAPAPAPVLDPQEDHLLSLYREMNEEGKEKVVTYAEDLSSSGKYAPKNHQRNVVEG